MRPYKVAHAETHPLVCCLAGHGDVERRTPKMSSKPI